MARKFKSSKRAIPAQNPREAMSTGSPNPAKVPVVCIVISTLAWS